jgi:hypothetical protein
MKGWLGRVGKRILPVLLVAIAGSLRALPDQQAGVFKVDFTNAQLSPSHWTLTLNPDGSGQFDADGGHPSAVNTNTIWVAEVHRPVQLSAEFTEQVFATARLRKWFNYPCESRMKVAFQGTKRLSYSGPEGSGECEFNYSKDKDIEALGNDLMAVENTILSGARMEKLLQHDRLGLDQELETLQESVKSGNSMEIGAIRDILTQIANDDQVMERARKRARQLLVQAH